MSVKSDRNKLDKLHDIVYSKIDPHERFKMVIKAYAQGEEKKREKIVRSCPMFTYLLSDKTYTDRIETSKDIVSIFLIRLLEYYNVISVMKITEQFNIDSGNDVLMDIKQLSEIPAFLFAFEEFCTEYLGVDQLTLIQAWHGYDDRYIDKIHEIKQFLRKHQIKLNYEIKEKWLNNVFISSWEKRINT